MNKIIKICVFLFVGCLFSACSSQDDWLPMEKAKPTHSISLEEALSSLDDFLDSEEGEMTRTSINKRKVDNTYAVTYDDVFHKVSRSNVALGDNLLYVANFQDDKGYAILSADDRIPEPVLAVVDKGSLSPEIVTDALNIINEERVIFPDYPMEGPGIFTLNEYPGETFMNPNTVDLYISEQGDTLVGDFDEEDEATVASISKAAQKKMTYLTTSYAIDQVTYNIDNTDPIVEKDNFTSDVGLPYSIISIDETPSQWSNIKVSPNLLLAYSGWDQKEPFNNYYPKRRKYLLFGRQKRVDAGCFPLAIAKIMTCLTYPQTFTYNGQNVDLKSIKDGRINTTMDENTAALLLRGISQGCDCWYFYQGTFTFPSNARSFMTDIGYRNVKSRNYNFDLVRTMIDNGKPLLIYGMPNINIFKSHCWNIDGYKIKVRTIKKTVYRQNMLPQVSIKPDTCRMVHCDLGWGGLASGYYVSGIFNIKNSENEFDGDKGDAKYNFNSHIRLITYDKY